MRNSSLVEESGVDNNRVLSRLPKPRDTQVSVGEHSMCVEGEGTTLSGAHGKANVGISNDKKGEIPFRCKTKVSRAMSISPGSVGS